MVSFPDPIPILRLRCLRSQWEDAYTYILKDIYTPSLKHLSVAVVGPGSSNVHAPLLAAIAHKTTTLKQPLATLSIDGRFIRMYREIFCSDVEPKDDSTSAWLEQHIYIFEYGLCLDDGTPFATSLAAIRRLFPVMEAKTLLFGSYFLHSTNGPIPRGSWTPQRVPPLRHRDWLGHIAASECEPERVALPTYRYRCPRLTSRRSRKGIENTRVSYPTCKPTLHSVV